MQHKSWRQDPDDSNGVIRHLPCRANHAGVTAEALLPVLMVIWLAGVSVLSLRLFTGWLWVQRLRTRGVAPADEALRQMAARLARRLHIARAVTLLESTRLQVPVVVGWLRPVLLVPTAVLGGLSPQQLEAVIAH